MKKFFSKLNFKNILMMNIGFISCAISSSIFLSPANMVASGATGLSILLSAVFKYIPYYVFLYVINGLLLILSFIFLGKDFSIKTIYGSLMLPTYGMIVSLICDSIDVDLFTIVGESNPTFVVIFASVLMGFGIGINMRCGGSTGGFDVLEFILNKYFHLQISTTIIILDTLLVIGGMFVFDQNSSLMFENAFDEGMAAFVYIVAMGFIVDLITFGGFNKRSVFIRSNKYEEISEAIMTKLARGLTYLDAEGGYSKEVTKMIVCICYSKEYFILRDMVNKIDPNAFIFVSRAEEVRGLGFSISNPEYDKKRKSIKSNKKNEG